MQELSRFQQEFLEAAANAQEVCVQAVLCRNELSLEDALYDATAGVIITLMELLDGYQGLERLDVVSQKTGERLREGPPVELHDLVCGYLKRPD